MTSYNSVNGNGSTSFGFTATGDGAAGASNVTCASP
jgi:hypothetical protein